ncbi:MAG: hypothetical protein IJ976_00160 [Alistipes sp.]|nr:hypothetical protein [Alistipes sp.]
MKNSYSSPDEQIISMLTPKVELKPSADMRSRILAAAAHQQAQQASQQAAQPKARPRRLSYWLGAAASVAAVVAIAITLTLNSPAYAARRYFSQALIVMQEAKTMVLKGSLRTDANESIDYINPQADFVPATVKVIYDDQMLFSIEKKGGRTVLYRGADDTGDYVYQWANFNNSLTGWKSQHAGFVNDELEAILNPRLLLEAEYRTAERNKGSNYVITEVGEMVVVRVSTTAQGDYSESDYMLNTSLAEANTLREYTFDKGTGLLQKLRIVIMIDGKPVTILESESIDYNVPLTAADLYDKALFDSITFNDMAVKVEASSPLIGIEADEAAEIILKAMQTWDMNILNTAMALFKGDLMKVVEERYKGVEVRSIGKAQSSGLYPGKFVKCKVIMPDGSKETLRLALRNDNRQGVWLVDGGL